jgi:hypothetical protein
MTHWTEASDLLDEPVERGFLARFAPGALAFLLSAALGVWIVYRPATRLTAPPPAQVAAGNPAPFGGIAPVTPAPTWDLRKPDANPYGELVPPQIAPDVRAELAEREVPLPPVPPADLRPSSEGVPLPPRRPSDLARAPAEPSAPVLARTEPRPVAPTVAPSPAPTQSPGGLFGGLFGKAAPAAPAPQSETRLAYAAPPPASSAIAPPSGRGMNQGGFGGFLRGLSFGGGGGNPTARFGERVAVYDISARAVYLPDGTKIEAHSGLGSSRDDPSRVNERMRGPTPPATYALTPRGELFHGVAALRLTPLDGSIYGRAGLLAHTYMLGPDGDSNGCVSFRDYDAFLRAYRSGQITKLVVVTRL